MLRPAMRRLDRRRNKSWDIHIVTAILLLVQLLINGAQAGFIDFENCLDEAIVTSSPKQLQFVPLFVNARFNTSDPGRRLNITIYGNVTGQAVEGVYPLPSDSSWSNPNDTFGKIVDVSPTNNKFTTLFERYQFLSYDASDAQPSEFCLSTINSSCPLGPSFYANASDPYSLSAFTVAHNLNTSYAFATVATTIRIRSGDVGAPDLACVSASITPDLGTKLSGLLRYLPVVVLIFVGTATMSAAMFSPWGTSDPFKWTTNYGRDEDLLRLVTPGFGDCLQYVQFIFLTGALSLRYPGYYQPAVQNVAWSSLVFNESFVTHGTGFVSLVDGIYSTPGTFGFTRVTQYTGMSSRTDLWACMAFWLAVLCLAAVALCQLAFLFRWVYFQWSDTTEEDLRRKNWPLTGGMLVRVVFNYFLLPIVAISMFQLLIAPQSRVYIVVITVILLFSIIGLAGWILNLIYRTKPRAFLFDDLPTLLLYGSLYNTYSDERALFALIPVVLTFMRGIAIGLIQSTGIAQLIVLAICEVVFMLTVHAFRPFSSPIHMNIMHTLFSAVRLITILLMVAFVPTLDVLESQKGWIGYVILILHGIVLVFGFFLNSIQTLIEVFARMAGAGGDSQHGARRGALISYNWKQLQNRQPNKGQNRPGSMASDAVMLASDTEAKRYASSGRTRSISASSRLLLANQRLSGMDQSIFGDPLTSPTTDTIGGLDSPLPGDTTPASGGQSQRLSQLQSDPYYRPPRARRSTLDPLTPSTTIIGRDSATSGEWGGRPFDEWPEPPPPVDTGEVVAAERDSPSPAFFRHQKAGSETDVTDMSPRPDYAVREVDFYYGVTRGPALSSQPTRKRKTGPADPMGPVSNASSWLQRLVGNKKKDQHKGFEVVRSSRAPPELRSPMNRGEEEGEEMQTSPPVRYAPYHDSPTADSSAPDIPFAGKTSRRMPLDGPWDSSSDDNDSRTPPSEQRPSSPPVLRSITRTPSINLTLPETGDKSDPAQSHSPNVPRRSSRRHGSRDISAPNSPDFPPTGLGFGNVSAGMRDVIRPESVGVVNHRLTGTSVFHPPQGDVAVESSAEFGGGERRSAEDGRGAH